MSNLARKTLANGMPQNGQQGGSPFLETLSGPRNLWLETALNPIPGISQSKAIASRMALFAATGVQCRQHGKSPEVPRFDPGSFDYGRLTMIRAGLAVGLVLFGMLSSTGRAGASDAPLIAAASSMQFALREIAQSYKQDTGVELRLTLGASGKLFRQIENNAPFELFISADDRLARELASSRHARLPRVILARGRLAVFAARGSPLQPDAQLNGLAAALAEGQISKFAIANPAHAPYGRRAREALQSAGLWARLQDKLVVGENVAQAAQFAISGAADGGIVAHSLLVTDKTSDRGRYALLPESWHRPILHSMVLLENSDDSTMAFFRYLRSPRAQQILSRFGYAPAP